MTADAASRWRENHCGRSPHEPRSLRKRRPRRHHHDGSRLAHNALNNALCDELREAWIRFRDSEDRVAVLASSEEAYFSVGADVGDLPVNMWHAVPGLGVELDKPVIAATSGWVVGGGFVLVQMADMCVASETTRFIYPEGKIGTTAGGVSSVVARMPHKIAMEFLLVGEELSAERAYQIGFVNNSRRRASMSRWRSRWRPRSPPTRRWWCRR